MAQVPPRTTDTDWMQTADFIITVGLIFIIRPQSGSHLKFDSIKRLRQLCTDQMHMELVMAPSEWWIQCSRRHTDWKKNDIFLRKMIYHFWESLTGFDLPDWDVDRVVVVMTGDWSPRSVIRVAVELNGWPEMEMMHWEHFSEVSFTIEEEMCCPENWSSTDWYLPILVSAVIRLMLHHIIVTELARAVSWKIKTGAFSYHWNARALELRRRHYRRRGCWDIEYWLTFRAFCYIWRKVEYGHDRVDQRTMLWVNGGVRDRR